MKRTVLLLAVTSCTTTIVEQPIELRPCDPSFGSDSSSSESSSTASNTGEDTDGGSTTSSEGGSSSSSTSDSSSSDGSTTADGSSSDEGSSSDDGSTGEPSGGLPTPTAPCPTIEDGVVTFCPAGATTCRDALVVNASGASGSGPLALHWHGTYESPDGVLSWDDAAQDVEGMVMAQDGLMVLPYADPAAVARANSPFPWWVVCSIVSPAGCTTPDDFALADEIVACALEQELVDPTRLTTSGMSAGGIMVSHLVDRSDYFAAAVSWSGGLQPEYRPATPAGDTTVMVIHGGPNDVYCGTGQPNGVCYDFVDASEAFAQDVVDAGDYAFLCDHQAGHAAAMGPQGAEFLSLATTAGHPWIGYPFGAGGNWMLDHYCYDAGDASPWE